MRTMLCAAAVLLFIAVSALAAEHRISSAADLEAIATKIGPGDVIVMADGQWKDQTLIVSSHGTAEKPVALRAETPGKAILSGKSSLSLDGNYLVASGILLKDGTGTGDGIALRGDHCRLTDSAVVGGTYKFFVHLHGHDERMDHCFLAEKTSVNPTLQIEVGDEPNHDQLDHNLFGHRPPLRRNGGETIRVGYSFQSMKSSKTVVEDNLFDRCDGEIEIISSKSCDNIYRRNTFLNCAGMLTLRHGNRCLVEDNFFLGNHKRGSGGIRVIGEDHTIVNNYIDGVQQGCLWITSGIVNSELRGYFQAKNALIAFNTMVDCAGPCITLDAGIGRSRRTLRPAGITIANNLIASRDGKLFTGAEGSDFKWTGNLASSLPANEPSTTVMPDSDKFKVVDAKLHQANDGLWRPAADSSVRGAASGDFAEIRADIDGQPRTGPFDVGCDQISSDPIVNRPLTAADVGPSWMSATERSK